MNLNKVTLAGHLTRDVEIKALPSGTKVANFSLAINRTWKDKDGVKQEAVEFCNAVAFGRTAEVLAQYVKKGHPLYVEGRLATQSWEKDGVKHYRTETIVDTFQFLNSASGERKESTPKSDDPASHSVLPNYDYPEEDINPEDIPF